MPYVSFDESLAAPAPALTLGQPLTNDGETLGSLREELRQSLGGRGDILPTRYDRWINWSYRKLFASLRLPEQKASYTVTTTEGVYLYMLPPQVSVTRGASIVNPVLFRGGSPLEKIDEYAYRRLPERTGTPTAFFKYNRMLVLHPTPDAEYEIGVDFRLRPLPLVADSDSPILDPDWHETILLGARKRAFSSLQEWDHALPADNEYVDSIRQHGDEDAEETKFMIIRSSVPKHGRMLRQRGSYRGAEPE